MTQPLALTNGAATLSPEDDAALDRTAEDLCDIPAEAQEAASRRRAHAYEVARRVPEGSLDPLSA